MFVSPYEKNSYENKRLQFSSIKNDCYYRFYSKQNIDNMSMEITKRLKGKIKKYPNITVSKRNILSIMDSVYNNVPNDFNQLYMITISYCVEGVLNDLENETKWSSTSVNVNTFPESSGIRQYSSIKLKEKGPKRFEFFEKY